jgi:MoxR-like ATPase
MANPILRLYAPEAPALREVKLASRKVLRASADFVGRERELERLRAVIDDGADLVTLVGPPGVGKTRLAMELIQAPRGAGGGGREWLAELRPLVVSLSEASDPGALTAALARALSEDGGEPAGGPFEVGAP